MQGAEPNRQEPQRNKQIVFIIAVYLTFTMFSHLTADSVAFNRNIINIINNIDDKEVLVKSMMSIFNTENYVGTWSSLSKQTLSILSMGQGKARMKIQKIQKEEKVNYELEFYLNNGRYIDEGVFILKTIIDLNRLNATRNGKSVLITTKQSEGNQTDSVYYRHQKLLQSLAEDRTNLTQFSLQLAAKSKNQVQITFKLKGENLFRSEIRIEKEESLMISTIIFATILFIISYMEFSAVMDMLRAMFDGRQSPQHYSIVTILAATMWDAVLCVVAFIQAFGNQVDFYSFFQESLILFIMPAFLLCLLFTNLELRVLLMIFQARSEGRSIREVVCKFNLITYGGLILMYPLMKFTNLSSFFFVAISLIIIPQIYCNAQRGQRPNISNAYYTKFLTFRFLLILYLKCFPWNIFDLEPNYLLSFSCTALLAFQIFMLWVQKQYGPKKVVPKFLLPPVFNYACDIQANVEEGVEVQCAICLSSLYNDPEPGAVNNLQAPFRVMRGPCGHKFHGACLSQWMQIKMECPQCRGKLPPFE